MNSKKYFIFISILFCLIFPLKIFANNNILENFKYSSDIILHGENEYKIIDIDKDILNKSYNFNLDDLRILDNSKEEVPYFSFSNSKLNIHPIKEAYPSNFLSQRYFENNNSYFVYKVNEKNLGELSDAFIEIDLNNIESINNVSIFGKENKDSTNIFLGQDYIYNINDISKNLIKISGDLKKYKYYVIVFENKNIQTTLGKIKFYDSKKIEASNEFYKNFEPEYSIANNNKETIISIPINQLKNLNLVNLTVKTNDKDFIRKAVINNIDRLYISTTIFNNNFENYEASNLKINLYEEVLFSDNTQSLEYIYTDDDLLIHIENQDNKPLNITGIEIEYLIPKIIFRAEENKNYKIHFNNKELSKAIYDIENFSEYILENPTDKVEYSKDIVTLYEEPVVKEDFKLFLNIAVGILSLILIFTIIFNLKKISK